MRRRPLLAGSDVGVLPTHFPAALSTLPRFHRVTPYFGLRLRRDIRGGNDLPLRLTQRPTARWAAPHGDRHIYRFPVSVLPRHVPEPEEPLSGLSSRRLWVWFARAFGKRSRPTSAPQIFDFGPQLLDHSMLVQNDLHQLFAAE
jgi:hypothetical protein